MSSKRKNNKRMMMEQKKVVENMIKKPQTEDITSNSNLSEATIANIEPTSATPSSATPTSVIPANANSSDAKIADVKTLYATPANATLSDVKTSNDTLVNETQSDTQTIGNGFVTKETEQKKPVKEELERNLFLQYNGLEFSDKLMFEAAVNDYCKNGVITESIYAVNLYVKPEEGKAYYVINHDSEKTGSIDL